MAQQRKVNRRTRRAMVRTGAIGTVKLTSMIETILEHVFAVEAVIQREAVARGGGYTREDWDVALVNALEECRPIAEKIVEEWSQATAADILSPAGKAH